MPGPAAVAAIGAGSSLLESTINAFAQGSMNKKTRKWNEKMYERQRADAIVDWERQNLYNSPAEQMKRLKAAGLNPNLVYGDGATTTAQAVRSTDMDGWRPEAPKVDFSNVGPSFAQMYDLEMRQAQTNNIEAQTKVAQMDAVLKGIQALGVEATTGKTKVDTERAQFELNQQNRLKDVAYEAAVAGLNKTLADTQFTKDSNIRAAMQNASSLKEANERIRSIVVGRAKTESERNEVLQRIKNLKIEERTKEWELKMRERGYNWNDPLWQRMLQKFLGSIWDDVMPN